MGERGGVAVGNRTCRAMRPSMPTDGTIFVVLAMGWLAGSMRISMILIMLPPGAKVSLKYRVHHCYCFPSILSLSLSACLFLRLSYSLPLQIALFCVTVSVRGRCTLITVSCPAMCSSPGPGPSPAPAPSLGYSWKCPTRAGSCRAARPARLYVMCLYAYL